jgi:hypothetical protein
VQIADDARAPSCCLLLAEHVQRQSHRPGEGGGASAETSFDTGWTAAARCSGQLKGSQRSISVRRVKSRLNQLPDGESRGRIHH